MPTCKCTKNGMKLCKTRSGKYRFTGKCRGKKGRARKGRKGSRRKGVRRTGKGKVRLSCTCSTKR